MLKCRQHGGLSKRHAGDQHGHTGVPAENNLGAIEYCPNSIGWTRRVASRSLKVQGRDGDGVFDQTVQQTIS